MCQIKGGAAKVGAIDTLASQRRKLWCSQAVLAKTQSKKSLSPGKLPSNKVKIPVGK